MPSFWSGRSFRIGVVLFGVLGACARSPHEDATGSSPLSGALPPTSAADPETSELDACATSTSKAGRAPLYLVFLFDRSLSMFGAKLANRWGPCKAATLGFFSSAPPDVHASLELFPHASSILACRPDAYAAPAVEMTALPSDAFKQTLDRAIPELGTPIEPALRGAVTYAQQIAAGEGRDAKTAIVLVSDGEPVGCGSSVEGAAAIAKEVASTIPTFVIGIGDSAALDAIAVSGSTKAAFLVKDHDAKETESEFRAALDAIRSTALACEYTIPAPPEGEAFDPRKVNVVHGSKTGERRALLHDPTCVGEGWRYDDEVTPKRVVLCPKSCADVESSSGELDVLFGCLTKDAPIK